MLFYSGKMDRVDLPSYSRPASSAVIDSKSWWGVYAPRDAAYKQQKHLQEIPVQRQGRIWLTYRLEDFEKDWSSYRNKTNG